MGKSPRTSSSNRRGTPGDALLSVHVPSDLLELIEFLADQRGVTLDQLVNEMLAEIAQIERIRHMSSDEARLEWDALGAALRARRTRGGRARAARARRAADAAWTTKLERWRATRRKPT